MNVERIKQRLVIEDSKTSLNADLYHKINLENSNKLLPIGNINEIVNVGDRFDYERQKSTFYRIIGTINSTISNALFNLDDTGPYQDLYTYKGFNYKNNQTNTYRFFDSIFPNVIKNNLKEQNGWFGYYDPNISKVGLCNYFDMEPKRQRFSFIPDIEPFHNTKPSPTKNWELTITYPYSSDSGHTMVNNGLLIIDTISVSISNRLMTAIGLPCKHNLNIGDIVRITGTNNYNGDHIVVRTGLDNGDLKDYYFVIDIPPIGSISNNSRIKRIVDNKESVYYFRLFKKIKTRNNIIITPNDYEIYKTAFSENIFTDDITQFVFNEDVDISGLTDNLNRPLTEIYLTYIKTNSNGLFTNVSSGIETPFIPKLNMSNVNTYLLNIPVINKIHNGGLQPFNSHIPLENNVTINNIVYYGDVCEYNENEVKEYVLADVVHRFNTNNRETAPMMSYITKNANQITNSSATTVTISLGPRHEGYYYKAHTAIKLKIFSNYIEQGDDKTVGIPDYAVKLTDGRYIWRDILDIGINEIDLNLNYPFLNGCHYLYNNYCFNLKRQDPFNLWNLYYSKFPQDPIGDTITDKFITNSADYVC